MCCSSCLDDDHLINTCPYLHQVITPEEIVKNFTQSETNFRHHFRRNETRKRFHSTGDFILIQSSAQALRDIIVIIKEEGIKETYRIDIDIDDFIDENPEGLPLERKVHELNLRNSNKNIILTQIQEDEDDIYVSQNKQYNKGFIKSFTGFAHDIEVFGEFMDIDKIEAFSKYFLHNNFQEIISISNKCAAQRLQDFTHKVENQRDSPEVLNRMIRITKSKTIRKKKSESPSPINKKKTINKEKEKDAEKPGERDKLKPRIRFSIFGKKEERIESSKFIKSKPEIKIVRDMKDSTSMLVKDTAKDPLLDGEKAMNKTEEKSEEEEKAEGKENKNGLSPKSASIKKPCSLDMKKKRKSTSCDGTYTLEDLLKDANLKDLEELVKMKKLNLNN